MSAEPLEQELFAGKIECEMLSSLIGLPGGDLVGGAIDSIKKPERRNIMLVFKLLAVSLPCLFNCVHDCQLPSNKITHNQQLGNQISYEFQ